MTTMAVEGSLDVFQLPEIFQLISQQRKTGILTVQGDQDIIAISFLLGEVVAADALNQSLEKALGQVLASEGLVKPKEFAAVAAEHQAGDGRLIDLLVERRHLSRSQLLSALRLQTYGLLLQLLHWTAGDFKFYSGDEVSYEEGFVPIPVEELLIRSLEEEAERGEAEVDLPGPGSVYRRLEPELPLRVLEEGKEPPRADAGHFTWVSPIEKGLLDRVDGVATVSRLAERGGVDLYRARFALHRLTHARLVAPVVVEPEPVEAPPPAPPPPEPVPAAPPPPPRLAIAVDEARAVPATPALRVWSLPALVASLVLVAAAVLAPDMLVLPFPWQVPQRSGLEKEQRSSILLKIDRAAKTFFLLEGHFPDDLGKVVDLRLVSRAELSDPQGRLLAYTPHDVSYTVQSVSGGEPVQGTAQIEAITGNFLLDPEFVKLPPRTADKPLVLLD